MRSLRLCGVAALLAAVGAFPVRAADTQPARAPATILMVGNSLTYTYGIPKIIENLAAEAGQTVKITPHTAGGKDLTWHWENASKPSEKTAKDVIGAGGFDLVILQEYSNGFRKAGGPEQFDKVVAEYLKAIRGKGMQPMFYMAHPTADAVKPEGLKPIVDGLTKRADDLGVPCAPVILAFIKCNEKYPNLALIDLQKDRKYALNKAQTHQSPFGSYLAACTLYASIYNKSPVGLKFAAAFDGKTKVEFDAADAKAAQEIAWEVWQDYAKARAAAKKKPG